MSQLEQDCTENSGIVQGFDAALLKGSRPEESPLQVSINQRPVGDQLRNFNRELKPLSPAFLIQEATCISPGDR